MVSVDIRPLIGKLDSNCRTALTEAISLALTNTHYNAEIEHWLLKLLEEPNGDLSLLLRHYGVDASRVNRDLTAALDRLKTGNSRPPALSPDIIALTREA